MQVVLVNLQKTGVVTGPIEASVRQHAGEAFLVVEALRRAYHMEDDTMTNLSWFVSRTRLWGNLPIIVLLRRDAKPYAAVLLYGQRVLGISVGVVKGGNLSGDGVVIAPAGQRAAALEAAASALLTMPKYHTVLASLRDEVPARTVMLTPQVEGMWRQREVATHLSLAGGFEGFLSRVRPRSRRNYRYFRRRAERDLGAVFVPALKPDEAAQAVQELCGASRHPVPHARARKLEAAIRGTDGAFAMGVRDATGRWLSYIAGWRQPGITFVEWQLNHQEFEAASLSTVMRTYFLEHEAAAGVAEVAFVGGSSAALGRYCAPARCSDLLAVRPGVRAGAVKALLAWLRPHGQVSQLLRRPSVADGPAFAGLDEAA